MELALEMIMVRLKLSHHQADGEYRPQIKYEQANNNILGAPWSPKYLPEYLDKKKDRKYREQQVNNMLYFDASQQANYANHPPFR